MKNLFPILSILLLCTLFVSCSGLFESFNDDSSSAKTGYITLSVNTPRTVLPSADKSKLTNLVLEGTKTAESGLEIRADSLSELTSKQIELETGSWSFTLSAKLNDVDFTSETVSANISAGDVTPISFTLSSTATGSFSLTVEFEGNATKATAKLFQGGGTTAIITRDNLAISENKVNFTPTESEKALLSEGDYTAEISFYGNSDTYPLNTYTETIRVVSGYESTASRTISLNRYLIYVSENGTESGDGTEVSPYNTLQKAIDYITTAKANDWIIYVSGRVIGNTDISSSSLGQARSVLISGTTGNDTDILDGNNSGTVIKSNKTVPITLENIKITGGNATTGGGLYQMQWGKFILSNGVLITGNTATKGSGIAVSDTPAYNLTIKGSAKVASDNNIYLNGKQISIASPLTEDTVATITPASYTAGLQLLDVAEGAGVSMSAVCSKFQVTPDGTTEYLINKADGKLSCNVSTSSELITAIDNALDGSTINITAAIVFDNASATNIDIPAGKTVTLKKSGTFSGDLLKATNSFRINNTNKTSSGRLVIDGNNTSAGSLLNCHEVYLYNADFKNNTSSTDGGAVHQTSSSASLTIEGSTFDNCSTTANGGAIYSTCDAALRNVTITNCYANKGGGLYCKAASANRGLTIINSSITGCIASSEANGHQIYGDTSGAYRCYLHTIENDTTDGTKCEGAVTLP